MVNIQYNSGTTLCLRLVDYMQDANNKNFTINIISDYDKSEYIYHTTDISTISSSYSVFEFTITDSLQTGNTIYLKNVGEYNMKIYENPSFTEYFKNLNLIYTNKLKIFYAEKTYTEYNLEKTYKTYE